VAPFKRRIACETGSGWWIGFRGVIGTFCVLSQAKEPEHAE
jgi:hypothetical protein